MPTGPIIDTHLHLWDPSRIRYPWLDDNAVLNRPYLLEHYKAASQDIPIEAMVFIQCEADFAAFLEEAAWISQLAATAEPRIKGLVAWAPLEKGKAVEVELRALTQHAILRGIRRIIQFESDLSFCLRPKFIAGSRTLADFGLSFDICIDYRHMANILKFVEKIPGVSMILDHIGKPDIRGSVMQPWASQMRELAMYPNVVCKLSGVATEADHSNWSPAQLRPYIDVAIDTFGFDRVMFGGDWPVSIQAIQYSNWIEILNETLVGVSEENQNKFWRGNAKRVYRL